MIKKIWFIIGHYPSPYNPDCAFLRPVITRIAEQGIECTVISAQSLSEAFVYHDKLMPYEWFDETQNHAKVRIIQPKYISFSSLRLFGCSLSNLFRMMAVRRAVKKLKGSPDLIYGHFWYTGVMGAVVTNNRYPVIVVSGEERIDVYERFGTRYIEQLKKVLKGLICVASKNLTESKSLELLPENVPTVVLPNAIDPERFHQMDKQKIRKELGIEQNSCVAVFVGSFEERKGVLRLVEAARQVPDLKLILIGDGPQKPVSDQIVFSGRIPHKEVAYYMNAADMFVLPTLSEGCCNAIVEAMACGLPVISSDRPFNDDVMTAENSIRIEPTEIDDIAQAMERLYRDKELRQRLAQGALATARGLNIKNRVQKIIDFMEETIDTCGH